MNQHEIFLLEDLVLGCLHLSKFLFTRTTNSFKTFVGYRQFYTPFPLLNGIQKGEYTPNT